MNRLFLSLTMLFLGIYATAQEDKVYISVAMPTNSILVDSNKTLLKNKLISIVSAEGVAATEYSMIVMVPEVNVLVENIIQSGMRNIYTTELCFTITVRNIVTNTIFCSLNIPVSGEGYSKIEAIRKAIQNIDTDKYAFFTATAKKKITDYYNNNTYALIAKANTIASQQRYEEALALLSTYPESFAGYPKVSDAIIKIYQMYLSQNCDEIMLMAHSAIAKRDFEYAADIAATINPSCSCFGEAQKLLKEVKKNVNTMYKTEQQDIRQAREANERIAMATVTAARDIAIAYFKQQENYIFFW